MIKASFFGGKECTKKRLPVRVSRDRSGLYVQSVHYINISINNIILCTKN